MVRECTAIATGEHAKAFVEAFAQLFGAEHLHPRRRELDREWNAVQSPADVGDDRRSVVG
jgi:hypothetical protein